MDVRIEEMEKKIVASSFVNNIRYYCVVQFPLLLYSCKTVLSVSFEDSWLKVYHESRSGYMLTR